MKVPRFLELLQEVVKVPLGILQGSFKNFPMAYAECESIGMGRKHDDFGFRIDT